MLAQAAATDDLERAWLAHYGAPLYGKSLVRGKVPPKLEELLPRALGLAHRDASVARALPVVFWRQRDKLNLEQVRRRARRVRQERTLGFFLDVAARLSGDAFLASAARSLRPTTPAKYLSDFFGQHGALERAVAEANTPAVARDWGYRMNMGMDAFESLFAKSTQPRA